MKPSPTASHSRWEVAYWAVGVFLGAFGLGLTGVSTIEGSPQTLGGVTLEEVRPRVVTPNGDARNDKVFFQFDTSVAGLPIEADIRDIRGARVSGLDLNDDEDALTWDGRDEDGRAIPSGVYIYSIRIGQSVATGTVIVAH